MIIRMRDFFDSTLQNLVVSSTFPLISCVTSYVNPYMSKKEKLVMCAGGFLGNYIAKYLPYPYKEYFFAAPYISLSTYQVTSAMQFSESSKLSLATTAFLFGDIIWHHNSILTFLAPMAMNLAVSNGGNEIDFLEGSLAINFILPLLESVSFAIDILPYNKPYFSYSLLGYNVLFKQCSDVFLSIVGSSLLTIFLPDIIQDKIEKAFDYNKVQKSLYDEFNFYDDFQFNVKQLTAINTCLQITISLIHYNLLYKASEQLNKIQSFNHGENGRALKGVLGFIKVSGLLLVDNIIEFSSKSLSIFITNILLSGLHNSVKKELVSEIFSSNIIVSAKANYTIDQYLHYAEDVIVDSHKLQTELVRDFTAVVNLNNNFQELVAIIIMQIPNYLLGAFYNFLNDLWKEFEAKAQECHAVMHKKINHISNNADSMMKIGVHRGIAEKKINYCTDQSILQLESICAEKNFGNFNYTTVFDVLSESINEDIDCDDYNSKIVNILSEVMQAFNGLKYYMLKVINTAIAGSLVYYNYLKPEDLLVFLSSFKSIDDVVNFQSYHQAELSDINIKSNILLDLLLKLRGDLGYEVEIVLDKCKNLQFSNYLVHLEGDDREFDLYIKDLVLKSGYIYGLIGENGSGKSTFLTSFFFAAYEIYNPAFNISGSISIPYDKIGFIPQRDIAPIHYSLYDIIMFPNFLPNHESEILFWLGELKVFNHAIDEDFLHEKKDDWFEQLSGGQKKKVQLITHFISCPDVLIMDETLEPLDFETKQKILQSKESSCMKDSIWIITTHMFEGVSEDLCEQNGFDHFLMASEGGIELVEC